MRTSSSDAEARERCQGCPCPVQGCTRGPLPGGLRSTGPHCPHTRGPMRDCGRAPDKPELLGEEIFTFQPSPKFLSALDQAETVKRAHIMKRQNRKH